VYRFWILSGLWKEQDSAAATLGCSLLPKIGRCSRVTSFVEKGREMRYQNVTAAGYKEGITELGWCVACTRAYQPAVWG
jgi:ribosomal protein S5